MLKGKRLSYGMAVLLYLLFMGNFVYAAKPANNTGLQVMQGKINTVDTSHNILVVDDMSYRIDANVAVVTAAGHKGRIGLLYPGKRIRMLVQFYDNGDVVGTIHKIYMLR